MKLNIGFGKEKVEDGVTTLDKYSFLNPNIIWNLEQEAYPLDTDSVDEVYANNVLEYLGDGFYTCIKELYRICKMGSIINITSTHHRSNAWYADNTHKRPITVDNFKQFSKKYCDLANSNSFVVEPLADILGIDLEIIDFGYNINPEYLESDKQPDLDQILKLAERFNNVLLKTNMKVLVIK